MAFLDHKGESEFPFSKEEVFTALYNAIPLIKGMKIENADKLQSRILVSAGISLYSWGEDIPIQLIEISKNKTRVQVTSSPKTGIMFGGAFDMGKNRKNIEKILSFTSMMLSSNQNKISATISSSTKILSDNYISNQKFAPEIQSTSNNWYEKTWAVIILCILFFPIGLYALWKNSTISMSWKIFITAIIALIVLANLEANK